MTAVDICNGAPLLRCRAGCNPESAVDAMAWRKYVSLAELYGFLGGIYVQVWDEFEFVHV